MIDFSPPPHVQATVADIHRFIADELKPIERDLAAHLTNEHLYLREDGRLAPEVLEAQRTIRKRSAARREDLPHRAELAHPRRHRRNPAGEHRQGVGAVEQ